VITVSYNDPLCSRCGEYVLRWHDCEYVSSDNEGSLNPPTSGAGSMHESNTN
jgi:hypothetical protein